MKFQTLVLLLLLPAAVIADDITLSWTNPTEQESCAVNGPVPEMGGTKIWQLVADVNNPTATTTVLAGIAPGDYTFIATAYTATGIGSRISGSTTKTVSQMVVTDTVVKIVSKIPGRFLLLGVGTIPIGTVCDHTTEVNGHFAVPFDTIVWSDPARNAGTAELPLLVVAKCG